MRPGLLRWGMSLWPPYLFAGVRVASIDAQWSQIVVEMRLRWYNRNFVGTHFGGSLFAMTDPMWMMLLLQRLGSDYVVWDKAGTIDFVKPGRGRVTATFDLPQDTLDAILAKAADGEKVLHWFENDVVDEAGEVVAHVRKQVYVRKKAGR